MKPSTHKQAIEKKGRRAEWLTCLWLILSGFRILKRRYRPHHRASSYGEIDIIAKRGKLMIFVEVKHRQQGQGDAMEALTQKQQQRITRSARAFLAQQQRIAQVRFDAVFFGGGSLPAYITNAWVDEAR